MSLVRRFARPLLAASFISGGIDTLRNPGPRVPAVEKVVSPLVEKVPQLSDVEQVVKIDAAIKVVAGTMFALGKFPRLSAAALIASLVPTTAAGHRFWEESDPAKRKQHQLHFLKNAGIVGGLMLAAVDTEGRPSLAWRAQHAPRALSHAANDLRRDAELALHSATGTLREATGTLRDATGTLHGAINPLHLAINPLHGAAETLHGAINPLRGATGTLHAATESLQSAAQSAAGTLRDRLPV